MFGLPAGRLLAAGAVLGLISLGLLSTSDDTEAVAAITINAVDHTLTVGQDFTVELSLTATEPVNAFTGVLTFDPTLLTISSIDYNLSVADLWAKEPWYNNGEGTLTFTGGTTKPGGFVGTEQLVQVTFRAVSAGETALAMQNLRILRHDGLGTDASVPESIDALFTITPEQLAAKTVSDNPASTGPTLLVLPETANTDLNNDGEQSIADTSIFMVHLATQNLRSDFNGDGTVNLKDLSILNHE